MKGYLERNREMVAAKSKAYCAKTVDRRRANQQTYYEKKKDRIRAVARVRYDKKREEIRERNNAFYYKNRERHLAQKKEYLANNLHVVMARNAARRAKHMKRKPKWLTREDFEAMRAIYKLAQVYQELTGEKFHVDHIYPLLGEFVSGLHVPGNLQILPAIENMKKKNRYTPK